MHVDMDAFFASVEQLDNPALRGLCVVVGGSHRGVVAAASYEARRFGIHSAMPIFQARQRCSDLVIVAPRKERYKEVSGRIMAILSTFSPLVEPISIDEAFVDITGCERLHGSARQAAVAVKKDIKEQIGLTCSVGVAPNKFLAKIASDLDKPDGLTLLTLAQMADFIADLPIGKVPGVGPRAQKSLSMLGISTLGQVKQFSEAQLVRRLGKFGHRLLALANGRDDRPVVPESEAKSMSSELTLPENTMDRKVLANHLLAQSETVARELRRHNMRARTVTLKIKTADFKQHTRNQTLDRPFQTSSTIYQTARSLLKSYPLTQPVRLIGVGAGNLVTENRPVQQCLFDDTPKRDNAKWEKVDRAVDAISERFGRCSVKRGSLTGQGKD